MKRRISGVTLCCVDTSSRFDWSIQALRRSLENIEFDDVFIASTADRLKHLGGQCGIRGIEIAPLNSIESYSGYVLRSLWAHVATSHALIVQWDGFVINPDAWTNDFLSFDYIGAPWRHVKGPHKVGNGGFSLRSRRLMTAVAERLAENPARPEDEVICQHMRPALEKAGLRFAPVEVARRFSLEEPYFSDLPFGFHGPASFPRVLGPKGTEEYLRTIVPPSKMLDEAGRQVLRGISHSIDSLIRREPGFAATRAQLAQVLNQALAQFLSKEVSIEEGARVSRALIRSGFFSLAKRPLQSLRKQMPPVARAGIYARLLARRIERTASGLPID